jgi:putative DNA primase/helicase
MVIPFERRFTDADKDPELFERIWTNELPGVLNRSLEGLKRLIDRGMKFDEPGALTAAKKERITQANPLQAFIEEKCELEGKCWMSDFYRAFKVWAEEMGFTRIQQQPSVGKNLKNLGYELKRGNKGKRIIGIRLK